jgi:uncharacterized membrane protein YphA (DoxX/SURF4 family)
VVEFEHILCPTDLSEASLRSLTYAAARPQNDVNRRSASASWIVDMKVMPPSRLHELDFAITGWMARFGPMLLRVSLGIVFLWFGVLKFFPNLSPAQDLATRTISILTGDLISPAVSLPLLAGWECLIGLGLLLGRGLRGILLLLYVQMLGTLTPLILFPHEVFARFPYAPTLEGQYIIKNLVMISAGIVVGATVRGGWMVPERPDDGRDHRRGTGKRR